MTKGGELDVWRKEAVCPWAGQRHHLCKLLIYWQIAHVLESNATGFPVMGHHSGLDHRKEDEVVIVLALDDTTSKPQPHRGLWVLFDVSRNKVEIGGQLEKCTHISQQFRKSLGLRELSPKIF